MLCVRARVCLCMWVCVYASTVKLFDHSHTPNLVFKVDIVRGAEQNAVSSGRCEIEGIQLYVPAAQPLTQGEGK